MGYKYEVYVFNVEKGYEEYHRGSWLIPALFSVLKARRAGFECVKLEIR